MINEKLLHYLQDFLFSITNCKLLLRFVAEIKFIFFTNVVGIFLIFCEEIIFKIEFKKYILDIYIFGK